MKFRGLYLIILSVLLLTACKPTEVQKMIEKKNYAKLVDGSQVYEFTLKNKNGMQANIVTYGATVVSLTSPDKNGKYEDVVLGYDNIDGYIKDKSYFGTIVGRYGNRIAKGKFTLDGKEYQLSINNGENQLHGGTEGFNKKNWEIVSADESDNGPSLTLKYISKDGEEGYPGNLKLTVKYSLTNDNELAINYTATTDKPTVLNPTHHSYFNLTGNPNNTILDHELMINADKFTPVDAGLIPTGVLENVENTPMDFRKAKKIGADINSDFEQLKLGIGYDHNWVVNKASKLPAKIAEVYEPTSGRMLEVFTDQPGVQFYCGNFLDGTAVGKKGIKYQYRTGFCLETQHFPDSPNKSQFPTVVLRPGEVYTQSTIYKFSAK